MSIAPVHNSSLRDGPKRTRRFITSSVEEKRTAEDVYVLRLGIRPEAGCAGERKREKAAILLGKSMAENRDEKA